MQLVRIVTINLPLTSEVPKDLHTWKGKIGEASFAVMRLDKFESKLRLLVAGHLRLTKLPTSSAGLVEVPTVERREIERGLQSFADPGVGRGIIDSSAFIELTPDILDSLSDRADGVQLLAEALSHVHKTGQFHDFVRLFERAFACSGKALSAPLINFLSSAPGKFEPDEIANWAQLRNPTTHAGKNDEFLVESDLRDVIPRMKRAAYEVIFNKSDWRSRSATRRQVWKPVTGTESRKGSDIFVTKGKAATFEFQILDEFGVFPYDLSAHMTTLPDGWWSHNASQKPS